MKPRNETCWIFLTTKRDILSSGRDALTGINPTYWSVVNTIYPIIGSFRLFRGTNQNIGNSLKQEINLNGDE